MFWCLAKSLMSDNVPDRNICLKPGVAAPDYFHIHIYSDYFHQAPGKYWAGRGIKFATALLPSFMLNLADRSIMYDLVSFVARGSLRKKVLKALLRPNSPTELARILNTDRPSVSRTILALEKVGLVECLTPDEKLGRFYRTTETGKKVVAIIEGKGE
jgi:DNA-binding transcriptional ArsR family regulator